MTALQRHAGIIVSRARRTVMLACSAGTKLRFVRGSFQYTGRTCRAELNRLYRSVSASL